MDTSTGVSYYFRLTTPKIFHKIPWLIIQISIHNTHFRGFTWNSWVLISTRAQTRGSHRINSPCVWSIMDISSILSLQHMTDIGILLITPYLMRSWLGYLKVSGDRMKPVKVNPYGYPVAFYYPFHPIFTYMMYGGFLHNLFLIRDSIYESWENCRKYDSWHYEMYEGIDKHTSSTKI